MSRLPTTTSYYHPSGNLDSAQPSQLRLQSYIQDARCINDDCSSPHHRTWRTAWALIDSGAGISLVSSRVAQLLHLKLNKADLQFSGVQGTPCKAAKHITNLSISPVQATEPSISLAAAVVATVTNDLPTQDLSAVSKLPHLTGLDLADPGFHTPGRIDILLGADIYHKLLGGQQTITGGSTDPAVVATIFGWAITGPVRSHNTHFQAAPSLNEPLSPADEHLDRQMTRFWDSEEPDKAPEPLTTVEDRVQSHYTDTTTYCSHSCRYTVTLPRKSDMPALGDSRSQALSRYINNERSILRRDVWKPFQEVVQSYLDLGHAELIPPSEPSPQIQYYLPMHSVTKSSSTSTKLRVVFDGSATTTSGVSLNQSLLIGPTLHPTLGAILVKGALAYRKQPLQKWALLFCYYFLYIIIIIIMYRIKFSFKWYLCLWFCGCGLLVM